MSQQQCKLCLGWFNKLENSHLLPAGIYRRLQASGHSNPNPWEISANGRVQTSRQITAYILCANCEQLFSRNGENWVLRNCIQKNRTFPLKKILDGETPEITENESKLYHASNISSLDISSLAYFGMSIFWRAAVHNWFNDWSPPISLGPYAEEIRQYLVGTAMFPKKCSLIAIVREPGATNSATFTPSGGNVKTHHLYKFSMPGLAFLLAIGKKLPETSRKYCLVYGNQNPIILTSAIEGDILADAVQLDKLWRHRP